MFCDGNCKTKRKTCGLYVTETLQEKMSGEVKNEEKCIFMAIFSTLVRSEHQRDGLHAAQNSTRNEATKSSEDLRGTLATGFLGLFQEVRKIGTIEVLDEESAEQRLAIK